MQAQSKIILSLSPSSVDAARVVRGRITARARVGLNPDDWASAWEQSLLPFDAALHEVMHKIGARRNARVEVIAETPSDRVEVLTVPGDAGDAARAGRLRFAERVDLPAGHPAVDAAEITIPSSAGESAVIAAADTDANLQRLYGWVQRWGGQLHRVVPSSACTLAAGLDAFDAPSDDITLTIYIDAAHSAVLCRDRDGLKVVRVFGTGVRAFAEAFRRGLSDGHGLAADGAGELARSLELVASEGLPADGAPLAERDHPMRQRVVPLLSPVLQRFLVEIKQTVRFGLGGTEMPGVIGIAGPGADIPGLAALIAEAIECEVWAQERTDPEPLTLPFARGSAGAWLAGHAAPVGLRPRYAVERQGEVNARRALLVGTSVPVIAAALMLASAWRDTVRLEREQDAFGGELRWVETQEATQRTAADLGQQLQLAAERSRASVGAQPDWSAVFRVIAGSCGETVRLEELRAESSAEIPTTQIIGTVQAKPGGSADDRAELSSLIERLDESDAVRSVRLSSTSVEQRGGRAVRRFTIDLEVVGLSLEQHHPTLPTIAGDTEVSP